MATIGVVVAVNATPLVEEPGAERCEGSALSRPGRSNVAGETLWDPLNPPHPENRVEAAKKNKTAIP